MKDQALKVAVDTITEFLIDHNMLAYIVVFDKSSFQISGKLFADIAAYIDDKYVDTHLIFNITRPDLLGESTVLAETQILPVDFETCEAQAPLRPSMAMPKVVSLADVVNQIDESFSQMLLRKIDEKGMTDPHCL